MALEDQIYELDSRVWKLHQTLEKFIEANGFRIETDDDGYETIVKKEEDK